MLVCVYGKDNKKSMQKQRKESSGMPGTAGRDTGRPRG